MSEFAIRLTSINELFWPFDAAPLHKRPVTSDVRFALLDEWDRVRKDDPDTLTVYAPASEKDSTDTGAVASALRSSLHLASGSLRRVDPLSRQQRVALLIGIAFLFASIIVSTAIDRASEEILAQGISQGVLVVGWVALWAPASRLIVEVVPHVFNKRRYAEFADIEVQFVWY